MDLDFSLEVTGFDTPEIDLRIGALSGDAPLGGEEHSDPADALPEALGRQSRSPEICGSAKDSSTRCTASCAPMPPRNIPTGTSWAGRRPIS